MANRSLALKEARSLFWPWCLVALGGTLLWVIPFTPPRAHDELHLLYSVSFWIGMPLLASLSLGSEFQHGTLFLLLSQPVARLKIWWIKWVVLTIAMVSAALIHALALESHSGSTAAIGFAWLVVAACSGAFWTLVAQSAIGGLVLNLLQAVIILVAASGWTSFSGEPVPVGPAIPIAAAVSYGLVMLWLGQRKLIQLQDDRTTGEDDLIGRSHRTVIESAGRWLRSRPTGALANLIRKEICLLWPVWLLTLGCVGISFVLLPFAKWISGPSNTDFSTYLAFSIAAVSAVATAVLAGGASLGEERSSGAHSWHLTLPVSTNLQWAVKLIMALIAGALGQAAIISAVLWSSGLTFAGLLSGGLDASIPGFILTILTLTVAAFWCACAVKGSIRVALWTIPAVVAVSVAFRVAFVGASLTGRLGLLNFVASRIYWFPFGYDPHFLFMMRKHPWYFDIFWVLPPLLFAIFQSRQRFRRELPDSLSATLRYLAAPAAFTFVIVFAFFMTSVVAEYNWKRMESAILETHSNVKNLGLDLTNTDEAHPRHLSAEEFSTVVASDAARRWLGNANLDVYVGTWRMFRNKTFVTVPTINTAVHLRNGWTCFAQEWFNPATGVPISFARCLDPQGKQ